MLKRVLGKRETFSWLVGEHTGIATVAINVEARPKAKNRTSMPSSHTTPGIHSEDSASSCRDTICSSMSIPALVI